jgi:WD40 repeat protein
VTASWDETLRIWDGVTGRLVAQQRVAHPQTPATAKAERFSRGNVSEMALDPTGRWLDMAVRDGRLLVIEPESGREVWSTDTHTHLVRSLDWSSDGSRLAAGSRDYRVTLWSTGDWRLVADLKHNDDVRAVAFTPDARLLATTPPASTGPCACGTHATASFAARCWATRRPSSTCGRRTAAAAC